MRKGTVAIPGRNSEGPAMERVWLYRLDEVAERIRPFPSGATLLKTSVA